MSCPELYELPCPKLFSKTDGALNYEMMPIRAVDEQGFYRFLIASCIKRRQGSMLCRPTSSTWARSEPVFRLKYPNYLKTESAYLVAGGDVYIVWHSIFLYRWWGAFFLFVTPNYFSGFRKSVPFFGYYPRPLLSHLIPFRIHSCIVASFLTNIVWIERHSLLSSLTG